MWVGMVVLTNSQGVYTRFWDQLLDGRLIILNQCCSSATDRKVLFELQLKGMYIHTPLHYNHFHLGSQGIYADPRAVDLLHLFWHL